jgi:hypothetical protein
MDWQNAIFAPGWVWSMLSMVLVVGSLVGLYRQLRTQRVQMQENTKLLRSQAHHNALTLSQRARELLIENEGFASVVNVGYATPEALNDVDWARCSSYMFLQFNQWEYLYYQHRDGSIPTEYWVGAEDYYRNLVTAKRGYARFWSSNQSSFDEPFRSYADQAFAKKPVPPPVA